MGDDRYRDQATRTRGRRVALGAQRETALVRGRRETRESNLMFFHGRGGTVSMGGGKITNDQF